MNQDDELIKEIRALRSDVRILNLAVTRVDADLHVLLVRSHGEQLRQRQSNGERSPRISPGAASSTSTVPRSLMTDPTFHKQAEIGLFSFDVTARVYRSARVRRLCQFNNPVATPHRIKKFVTNTVSITVSAFITSGVGNMSCTNIAKIVPGK